MQFQLFVYSNELFARVADLKSGKPQREVELARLKCRNLWSLNLNLQQNSNPKNPKSRHTKSDGATIATPFTWDIRSPLRKAGWCSSPNGAVPNLTEARGNDRRKFRSQTSDNMDR